MTPGILNQFMSLHQREWHAKGKRSQYEDPSERNFLGGLAQALTKASGVHLDCLWWGDELVAGHVGFRWARREYYYKPCYDPDIHRSTGKLLLGYLLSAAAVDNNIDEFDFLNGLEPYKVQHSSDLRETCAQTIYRTGFEKLLGAVRRRLG